MNSDVTQQQVVDSRNLLFTLCGLVALLFILTVFLERRPVIRQEHVVVVSPPVMEKKTFVPRTTVNIQPLVTRFPPLPDFNSYQQVEERKGAFIDYMTPIIEYQNDKILRDRDRLEKVSKSLVNGELLSVADKTWLKKLAARYEVEWSESDLGRVIIQLARRVDIIPVSLALVQAAKESSWGRSRYAVSVNNMFGQWCFDEGCGVIPSERVDGARHEIRKFSSVYDATRSYMHNLNTHPKYSFLRQIRQYLRIHNQPITGNDLADGLLYYSERRQAYVDEVKSMIQQYRIFEKRRTG